MILANNETFSLSCSFLSVTVDVLQQLNEQPLQFRQSGRTFARLAFLSAALNPWDLTIWSNTTRKFCVYPVEAVEELLDNLYGNSLFGQLLRQPSVNRHGTPGADIEDR